MFYPHVTVVHEYGRGSYRDWRLLCHHSASAVRYFNKWGWWFDEERERVNARALGSISLAKGEVGIDAAGDVAP